MSINKKTLLSKNGNNEMKLQEKEKCKKLRWKKIRIKICMLVTIMTLVSLITTGCTTKPEATHKKYVAVITKSTDSDFWKSVYAGANAASTEYNLDVTMDGPAQEEDYKTQNQMIEQAVKDGADAIVFSASDYNGNADAINAAAEQGVKIISIDSDVNSDKVSCRIGTDNYAAGGMAGKAALDCDQEELRIGIVNYGVNTANGQQREQGFRNIVSYDERVKYMKTINVLSTTADAEAGTKKLIKENPDINVIVTFNEWTTLGVGWAIRSMRLSDQIRVVAFDSNVISVGMMETGEVDALVVQNPYAMGYLGIEMANNAINGHPLTSDRIDTATTVVTKENMFTEEKQRILFTFN